jgi:hypothetical protein
MHWVDLSVGLPTLHTTLRPRGRLAIRRHRFDDDRIDTEFRRRVKQIVSKRTRREPAEQRG